MTTNGERAFADAFAWQTTAMGVTSIVLCRTAEQARYVTALQAQDAGYHVLYRDVRCKRAAQFDGVAALRPKRCYSLDTVADAAKGGG